MIEYLQRDTKREGDFVLVRTEPCPFRVEDPECPQAGKDSSYEAQTDRVISIPGGVWYRYGIQRQFIQDAWPDGDPGERERLVNGAHDECFERAVAAMDPEAES